MFNEFRTIKALVIKDTSLYFRNRSSPLITVLGIIFYIAFYFLMPKSVDETLEIGLYAPMDIPSIEDMKTEGFILIPTESDEQLQESVISGEFSAGIALPVNTAELLEVGQFPDLTLYLASDVPITEKQRYFPSSKKLAYQHRSSFHGCHQRRNHGEDMLAPDTSQRPPAPSAGNFSDNVRNVSPGESHCRRTRIGNCRALMVTPMSVREFFVGKGIFGIGLAFIQSIVFMAIVGGLSEQPLLIIFGLFLGSIMATAIGFLIGSLARDFMSVLAWGMILFIILLVPAFGIMFPGTVTGWVEYIPSYYLVDLVHRVAGFGAGWGDVWLNIAVLSGFSTLVLLAGMYGIRSKAL